MLSYSRLATDTRRAFCLWSGRRQPPTPTPGSGRLRSLSHWHPCITTRADGQSGRTSSGKDRCVHSLITLCCVILGLATGICCASGGALWLEVEAPPLPNRCLHLAQSAATGLIFDGTLFFGCPSASCASSADGRGGALTFQLAVPHPLVRA